uniref:hypothetical protein n=1 Tax=Prevotella sp. TaxID=59823 RepID=UPI00402A18E4
MKKRFTLMMMVLCFLMSIPLEMMAYDKVEVVSHYKQGTDWKENPNFNFQTNDGIIYTCTLNEVPAGTQAIWFRIKIGTTEYGPQQDATKDLTLTSSYQQIYQIKWEHPKALMIEHKSGETSYTITYNHVTKKIKYDVSEGGSTGSGSEGSGGSTTVEWNTENINRLKDKPRVYTQGFYLAGNFFSFSDPNKVTYDDAVFKFQQQKNKPIGETDYEIYKVEIPASLTAHAQVMYVNEVGKIAYVFGPGSVEKIDKDKPVTDTETDWASLNANESTNLLSENSNYWDLTSRNVSETEYSDGMYELYIAFDKVSNTAKWMIKHIQKKRVAYFISTDPSATALPVYDFYKVDNGKDMCSNQFFATVYFASDRDYYVISNYINKDYINYSPTTQTKYGVIVPDENIPVKVSCPTTNKLFLLGNGGVAFDTNNEHNEFSPNQGPMMGGGNYKGAMTIEYNPSNGNGNSLKVEKYLAMRGQVQIKSGAKDFESVSLVGDPFPGTYTVDESGKNVWDYTSPVVDMTYDETELCYVATVTTTVADNGKSKFRFVANHEELSNWYEDTTDDPKKKARIDYSKSGDGHTAAANDPNKVSYKKDGTNNPATDIIWNRPEGTWVVRLYFYTYSEDGVTPKTDYYYTISEKKELDLRDFSDVVYKTEGNVRNILLRGDYKYFRSWSSSKPWKISNDVDIFIVNAMDNNPDGTVSFSLKKISASSSDNVIPAGIGVILATKKDADVIDGGGVFHARPNFMSHNTLTIPLEEYNASATTVDYGPNLLVPISAPRVVPTSDETNINYLFGYYHAITGTGNSINPETGKTYEPNDFLMGFWISNGKGLYPSNSAYLPVPKAKAEKLNLGVKYDYKNFDTNPGTGAKKIPALFFDFAKVGSGTTGINEVVNQSTKLNDGKYYTLSGQQVEKPTAGGIYIHNGRKFVVK